MLKLSNTPENVAAVEKGRLLWLRSDGIQFSYTSHGIIMKTTFDMFVVTPKEYAIMRIDAPPNDVDRSLYG
jgi:hypothetical protein